MFKIKLNNYRNKFQYLFLLLIAFVAIFTSGCDNEKAQVLYNTHPFDINTINSNTNVFRPNQRIYYLITLPKPIQTKMLYIQIMKMGSNERLGYDLVWARRVKLKDEQVYYYTDYVAMSSAGSYVIKVYSQDEPTKLLTTSQFYVRN